MLKAVRLIAGVLAAWVWFSSPPATAQNMVSLNCPADQEPAVCLIRRAAEHPAPLDNYNCRALYVSLLHLGQYDVQIRGCEKIQPIFAKLTTFRLLEAVSRHHRGDRQTASRQFQKIGSELKAGDHPDAVHVCFVIAAAMLNEPLQPFTDNPVSLAGYQVTRSLMVLSEGKPEAAKAILEEVQFTEEMQPFEAPYFFAVGVIGSKLIAKRKVDAVLTWLKSVPMNWRSHGQVIAGLLDHGYRREARALAAQFLREGPTARLGHPWAEGFKADMLDVVLARAFIRQGEHLAAAQVVTGAYAFRKSANRLHYLRQSNGFSPAALRRFFIESEGIDANKALARLAAIYSAEGKFIEAVTLARNEAQLKQWITTLDYGDAFFLIYALLESGRNELAEYGLRKWETEVFLKRVMHFNRMNSLPSNFRPSDIFDQFFVRVLRFYHDALSGRRTEPDPDLLNVLYQIEGSIAGLSQRRDYYALTKAIFYLAIGASLRQEPAIAIPGFFREDRFFYMQAAQVAAGLRDGRSNSCDLEFYLYGYHTSLEVQSVGSNWTPGDRLNRFISCCISWRSGTLVWFYEGA